MPKPRSASLENAPELTPAERISAQQDIARAGSFTPHGDFIRNAPRSALWYFVDGCVSKRRREPKLPPAHYADGIRNHRAAMFAKAFPSLEQWAKLEKPRDWAFVNPRNAAESAITFALIDEYAGTSRSIPYARPDTEAPPELLTASALAGPEDAPVPAQAEFDPW